MTRTVIQVASEGTSRRGVLFFFQSVGFLFAGVSAEDHGDHEDREDQMINSGNLYHSVGPEIANILKMLGLVVVTILVFIVGATIETGESNDRARNEESKTDRTRSNLDGDGNGDEGER